jgi:tungstate transport system substrate-binding protein
VTPAATVAPTGAWYITAAGGMLPCLQVTAEKGAYTLTDTATWLKNKSTLSPLVKTLTKKEDLKNQYSVLLLNQAIHDQVASTGAEWLAAWMVSYDGQKAIGDYGKAQYKQPLFFPNAFTISDQL